MMTDAVEVDHCCGQSEGNSGSTMAPPHSHSVCINSDSFFTVKSTELTLQSMLGAGAQAQVYKAAWTRVFRACTSSITVAVKVLHADLDLRYRDREALMLITDHPNLVKCFDCTLDPPFLIVTEFCAGGSLFDVLYNSAVELSLRQQVKILLDVAGGMHYLHSQQPKILHRDLKSSNVLLSRQIRRTEQELIAKVADFGLSRTSNPDCSESSTVRPSDMKLTVGVGTWRWMAPEVFDLDENQSYDERADVYSFGMLMYEVLARKMPYIDQFPTEASDPRIGLHICLGLRPSTDVLHASSCPSALIDLMQKCWDTEVDARPTFETIQMVLQGLLKLSA